MSETKKTLDHIRIPFSSMRLFYHEYNSRKTYGDNVGWQKAFLVYQWVYSWQILTKKGYGKPRKKDIFKQIEQDLIEPKPHIVVNVLIKAGLLTWGSSEYNGRKVYCLQCVYLNEKMGKSNNNPELTPKNNDYPHEEETLEVQSSAPDNGEFIWWGYRCYRDENGQVCLNEYGKPQLVPPTAPPRPTRTAVWNDEYSRWFEPGEEPVHEMEF